MNKPDKTSFNSSDSDDTDDYKHPDWDDEKWRLNKDDDDLERPEWDDEKWQSANLLQKLFIKTKVLLVNWWNNPRQRNASLVGVGAFCLMILAVPTTRYQTFNVVGVRASARVSVVDSHTNQPLKNVDIVIANMTSKTDRNGDALFSGLRLGNQDMVIKKLAYADQTIPITLGTGTTTIDSVSLIPVGITITINTTDYVSELPLQGVEATFGESSALSNEAGDIGLVVPPQEDSQLMIILSAENYRDESLIVDIDSAEVQSRAMVLSQKHYYISNRDDRYDLYASDLDGTNEAILLRGSSSETNSTRVSTAPDSSRIALVASRAGQRNKDGFLKSELYIVNPDTKENKQIDTSERIDLVGWIGKKLLYLKVQEGASGRSPQRQRLVSYDIERDEQIELAASNYFNDILVTQNYIFFAPSDAYKENPTPYLYRINPDGNDQRTVIEENVWTIVQRDDINSINFDAARTWRNADVDSLEMRLLDGPPANRDSRLFIYSPDKSKAMYIDQRDGKGVLVIRTLENGEEQTAIRAAGVRTPARWIDNETIQYRVVDANGVADYVLSLKNPVPKIINDVAEISGVDRWYYYY